MKKKNRTLVIASLVALFACSVVYADSFNVLKQISNKPVQLKDGEYKGKIKKDFVLPNSYRNPRINLMIAHGIALGLYSPNSKMPMDLKTDWEARGYKVIKPNKLI